jgi:outer membrane receptor protein involved in Fe transport
MFFPATKIAVRLVCVALTLSLFPAHSGAATNGDTDAESITEIVVTSQRRPLPRLAHAGNVSRIDDETLADVRHQHLHELLTRIAGVWLSRGSGQEHLTALRSPVLTGAGSCGAFLVLEDGIPVRPAGFCNVNQFIELDTEQAQAIEIIRGPGSALYGSNALHGIVNVVMTRNAGGAEPAAAVEVGANDYLRVRARLTSDSEQPWQAALLAADDGGFRDDSGYRQYKAYLSKRFGFAGGQTTAALSVTDLDQETAGFIFGRDAYLDEDLRTSNPNPEAFREASSRRLYALWERDTDAGTLDLRPYLRDSDMRFLQHFLPGQPLEENGHTSAGILSSFTMDTARATTVVGIDVEWSHVYLRETQDGPTEGSDFLRETRPAGRHYDYVVDSMAVAPYVHADIELAARWTLSAGLRGEYIRYDYDNRMLDGNTRDDGTPCGFGGCLFTRPADRSDDFVNLAPKLALSYALSDSAQLYTSLARGFRAPQMTELYRLQSGQQVADLDSETLDSIELGVRIVQASWRFDGTVYAMQKRDSVFRDAEGFNVSGARTRHSGVEVALDWNPTRSLTLSVDASYAKHVYDFDLVAARGETFVSGRDVDTAPRWLASAEAIYRPSPPLEFALQWTTIGPYYLDAENTAEYPGHDLLNGRLTADISDKFTLSVRVNNLTDEKIADRADFAFGNYRYFPGRGRELFAELVYRPSSD